MIYKIATQSAWDEALSVGAFRGSEDDRRDGYIHLSAAHQVRGTAEKYFRNQADLLLIAFAEEKLRPDLKWEPARGADFFPHLYAPLPTSAALWTRALQLDGEGVPIIPEDVA
jgi:uncharacterized protein (DUF952 family)